MARHFPPRLSQWTPINFSLATAPVCIESPVISNKTNVMGLERICAYITQLTQIQRARHMVDITLLPRCLDIQAYNKQ